MQMDTRIKGSKETGSKKYITANVSAAVGALDHTQLAIMAKVLIPERANTIFEEYQEVFKSKGISEVDLVAGRTAAGKAGKQNGKAAVTDADKGAAGKAGPGSPKGEDLDEGQLRKEAKSGKDRGETRAAAKGEAAAGVGARAQTGAGTVPPKTGQPLEAAIQASESAVQLTEVQLSL